MNRILCLAAMAVALSFAFTSSANAQMNMSLASSSDALYDYEVHTGTEGYPGGGFYVVIYRASEAPQYVGTFQSPNHANYWAFMQFEHGLADDWRYYEIEYGYHPVVTWELQGTYDTRAKADLAVAIFNYLGYQHIRIERINGLSGGN